MRSLIAAGAMLVMSASAAFAANPAAEQYVEQRARAAIATLNDTVSPIPVRAQNFRTLMQQLADVPRIANFVLGVHAQKVRADPALQREWQAAFMDYSVAVYQDQLEQYRGNQIRVTGSIDRVADRDIVVRTEIVPVGQTRPQPVQWRLLKSGADWKVVDVALVLNGNEVWLAQQQRRDFLAELDRNRGDVRALIQTVKQQTEAMRARINARR